MVEIGTVIIPKAELKVFVDADVWKKHRRWMELKAKGETADVEEIAADLESEISR